MTLPIVQRLRQPWSLDHRRIDTERQAADIIEALYDRLKQADRENDAGRPILAATAIKLALSEVETALAKIGDNK